MRISILAAALLAGCTTMAPPPEPTGPCVVDEAMRMRFAGVKFRMDMRDAIQGQANARLVRLLRPGDVTTKDFREDRLNIMLDDGNQISGLRCG